MKNKSFKNSWPMLAVYFLIPIFSYVFMYVIIGFVKYNFDVSTWTDDERLVLILIGTFWAVFGVGFMAISKSQD